ncbi:MAG: YidC/Oxa1 family membrane protein insertase [Halanaerobiales bacterium]|nr:YidC/Oxa1 family membrane protein insertase [Halanaerobiales bacterium]
MFGWLINGIVEALKFLNGMVHNYGVTIILFTLIIKLVLYPLTAKQTKSMKAMQDLQPEMDKIKKKHKDDKEKQQKAMMDLYKENNVNPAAGCLPMILQLAILIPLYRAILSLSDILNESSFLWIGTLTNGSLAEPDIAIVLVNALAMIAQTYVTQKMQAGNSKNNMIMWIMPAFIIFIGFRLPSGILLYWFTSTVFTAVQQYLISKEPIDKEVANQ